MKPSQDNERMARAREIAENPENYKICEGCDSIVGSGTTMCRNCHAYRFDPDPQRVAAQALALGRRAQRSVTAQDLM